jgi:hypothetical protein
MELEEILRLDRYPFDYGAMGEELDRETEETALVESAHFVLFLRYMERFVSRFSCHIPVPRWNCYMAKTSKYMFCHGADGSNKPRSQIMEEFFEDIMDCCGWSVKSIRLTGEGELPEFSPGESSVCQEWERIFSYMPGFLELKKQGYWNIKVTVCQNRAIYDYYDFCRKNEDLVKEKFSDAAEVIERILRRMADPFALGLEQKTSCYENQKYIVGFFEAYHSDMHVSILDMDYNFMVQILILHMLINCAERRFGYRQEGEVHGTV